MFLILALLWGPLSSFALQNIVLMKRTEIWLEAVWNICTSTSEVIGISNTYILKGHTEGLEGVMAVSLRLIMFFKTKAGFGDGGSSFYNAGD